VQATCDIQALADFLRQNFYHHESLIFIADYLRLQGKFSDAAGFLERCLFAFEQAFSFDFQFVPSSSSQEDKQNFRLQSRIDWEREPLNKVFAECLIKHIDLMGRKGCNRTGLEFCKLLLSLDPYGVLLRIDYYAIRAKEFKYLRQLIKQLPFEVHPGQPELVSYLVLPNLLMSTALSRRLEFLEECEAKGINTLKACCSEANVESFLQA
jgi:hypothetical protein